MSCLPPSSSSILLPSSSSRIEDEIERLETSRGSLFCWKCWNYFHASALREHVCFSANVPMQSAPPQQQQQQPIPSQQDQVLLSEHQQSTPPQQPAPPEELQHLALAPALSGSGSDTHEPLPTTTPMTTSQTLCRISSSHSTDPPRPSSLPSRPSSDPPRPSSDPPRPSSDPPRPSSDPPRPSSDPPRPSSDPPRPSSDPPRPSPGSDSYTTMATSQAIPRVSRNRGQSERGGERQRTSASGVDHHRRHQTIHNPPSGFLNSPGIFTNNELEASTSRPTLSAPRDRASSSSSYQNQAHRPPLLSSRTRAWWTDPLQQNDAQESSPRVNPSQTQTPTFHPSPYDDGMACSPIHPLAVERFVNTFPGMIVFEHAGRFYYVHHRDLSSGSSYSHVAAGGVVGQGGESNEHGMGTELGTEKYMYLAGMRRRRIWEQQRQQHRHRQQQQKKRSLEEHEQLQEHRGARRSVGIRHPGPVQPAPTRQDPHSQFNNTNTSNSFMSLPLPFPGLSSIRQGPEGNNESWNPSQLWQTSPESQQQPEAQNLLPFPPGLVDSHPYLYQQRQRQQQVPSNHPYHPYPTTSSNSDSDSVTMNLPNQLPPAVNDSHPYLSQLNRPNGDGVVVVQLVDSAEGRGSNRNGDEAAAGDGERVIGDPPQDPYPWLRSD